MQGLRIRVEGLSRHAGFRCAAGYFLLAIQSLMSDNDRCNLGSSSHGSENGGDSDHDVETLRTKLV